MSTSPSSPPQPERGRPRPAYQRSVPGLLGAMLVLLVVVGVFVIVRAVNRDDLDVKAEPIDYLPAIAYAQEQGLKPIYPASIDKGWKVTSLMGDGALERPWGLGMLTDTGQFVGLRVESRLEKKVVEKYIDEAPKAGEPVQLAGQFAGTWNAWSDGGGDRGVSRELPDGRTIVVWGAAQQAQLERVAAELTDRPVKR